MNYKIIDNYVIFSINHIPILFDKIFLKPIVDFSTDWKINNLGFVYTYYNNTIIYFHDAIFALYNKINNKPILNQSIIHINKIPFDNRAVNLMYDISNKIDIKKNLKKRKRIIKFKKNIGFSADDIPSFMCYLAPESTHGERFTISIGDVHWKTTSSYNLSIKYKFEEGKKYLRELKKVRPDLFNTYSMNGELNYNGKLLLKSFIDIINKTGINLDISNFDHLTTGITDSYLKEDLNFLNDNEILLLKSKKFF